MKPILPLAYCFILSAAAENFTFNPVTEFPNIDVIKQPDGVVITWFGGGHLEQWQEASRDWNTIAIESPFTLPAEGVGLFRAIDPWNGGRKVTVTVPKTYTDDPETPIPIVVVLHGYHTSNYMAALRYASLAETKRFIFVQPNGLKDSTGHLYWNATDTCCDYDGSGMDDAGYLRALVEGLTSRYNVDTNRIYFIGHSNGGAMANRMACQHADLVAGIVNMGGFNHFDQSRCQPSEPVHTLHIGGTNDPIYQGETMRNGNTRPGLLTTVESWTRLNGHDMTMATEEKTLDLENLPGMDTQVTRYAGGAQGGAVELWSTVGGAHTPSPRSSSGSTEMAIQTIDWLFTHPKRSKIPFTIASENNRLCDEDGCDGIRAHVMDRPLAEGAAYRAFFHETGTASGIGDYVGEYAYDIFTTEIPGLPDPVPFKAIGTIIMTTSEGDQGFWQQETHFLPNNRAQFEATLVRGTGKLEGVWASVRSIAKRDDAQSPWKYVASGWRHEP